MFSSVLKSATPGGISDNWSTTCLSPQQILSKWLRVKDRFTIAISRLSTERASKEKANLRLSPIMNLSTSPFSPPIPSNKLSAQAGAILPIYKPLGWTSFEVVKKVRTAARVKKVGHAGTLDPLATGLLIICTGKQTKAIRKYQDLEKIYQGELVLGKTTPSIDLETDFDGKASYSHVTAEALHQLATSFIGYIKQIPPAYSAIKTKGVRAYKQARQGQRVVLLPRQVWIKDFTITSIHIPRVSFEVTCGKGTYIRSLVRDFGEQLGTGAYLASLCRTRIGPYTLQNAYGIVGLDSLKEPPSIYPH